MARESFPTDTKGQEDGSAFQGRRDFGDGLSGDLHAARLQAWDPNTLAYIDLTVDSAGILQVSGGGGGGGGAVTVADGADVALGARSDAQWDGAAASATAISLLKYLAYYTAAVDFKIGEQLFYIQAQSEMQTRLDDVGGGVTYVGKAYPGNFTSAAQWQIKRITETAGDIVVEFADGDNFYDNIWDNRAGLSYS
jgi:hypothetical protein